MSKEALRRALEALEMYCEHGAILKPIETRDAIKEALAQPDPYMQGYADANNWKVQNHLEHLPAAQPEYDYKDLYEKEKRRSAMWLAKYEEVAGPAPKAYPVAQQEQEPVAHLHMEKGTPTRAWIVRHTPTKLPDFPIDVVRSTYPLFLRAPPRRNPLTDQQIEKCFAESDGTFVSAGRAIEAAHGIKE